MNKHSIQTLRQQAALCAALACLPVLLQLPPLMIALVVGFLLLSFFLPKPHIAILFLLLIGTILSLLISYRSHFGRDTAACMLALMMSLKCLETKLLRDVRAVLGFSLFLPFSALLNDQSPLSIGLSLLCMANWLQIAESSATGTWRVSTLPRMKQVLRVSQQMLFALPIVVILFWVFPRISTPLWGLPGLSNQGAGLGDSMQPGQWIDTLSDDRIAFRVKFSGTEPSPQQRYWRGPVLWDFDGQQWTRTELDSLDKTASLPRSENTTAQFTYTVSLEPTEKKYLPSLDWPTKAPDTYYFSQEQTVYSNKPIQKFTQYSSTSSTIFAHDKTLNAMQRQRALRFPLYLNKRTQQLAKQWRNEAGSDRAYIEKIMQWIRRDFSYTLDTPIPETNAVDQFLFSEKKGFCQHFSSSFALLMRAAGIPTRVVTGYVGGYKNSYGNYWILYQKDAHAWNEVWLENEGWVRFDATAEVAPENILDTLSVGNNNAQTVNGFGQFNTLFDFGDFVKTRWNDWVIGFNARRQMQMFQNMGLEQIQRWQLLSLVIFLTSLVLYIVFLFLNRSKAIAVHPLEYNWHLLVKALARKGYEKSTHETAINFAARMHGRIQHSDSLIKIATRYNQWRYSKIVLRESEIQIVIREIRALIKSQA